MSRLQHAEADQSWLHTLAVDVIIDRLDGSLGSYPALCVDRRGCGSNRTISIAAAHLLANDGFASVRPPVSGRQFRFVVSSNAARPAAFGLITTPRSVISALTSSAGVTSKAGL